MASQLEETSRMYKRDLSSMDSVNAFLPPGMSAASENGPQSKVKNKGLDSLSGPSNYELTAKQKQDIKEAFSVFDPESTGFMQIKELKIAMRALGFEPKKNEIKKLIHQVDKARAGQLSFDDFVQVIYSKLSEKDCKEEIMKAFKLFDKDQTGKITFENLQQIAVDLGEGLTDDEVSVKYKHLKDWNLSNCLADTS
ncbi:unnamed protein product [Allacma fusca]|uniref:EF-hand domain-containing protein n=2 Tax=Allacma fusca TaxID=39272 RepID=A0A8J2KSJ0_9HEXA|nr:unnamed protein product [Allacma fusca]